MATTSHGPLTAAEERVVKVIPKENSLGSRGRPGCGCRRFVPAGHEHESDQPLEQ